MFVSGAVVTAVGGVDGGGLGVPAKAVVAMVAATVVVAMAAVAMAPASNPASASLTQAR